jgi:glycosidase
MKLFLKATFLFWILLDAARGYGAVITFNEKDATVWLPTQLIAGRATGAIGRKITVYCNGTAYPVKLNSDHTFKLTLTLVRRKNEIWATYQTYRSQKLNLTLGYSLLPVVRLLTKVEKNEASLNASVVSNPGKQKLKYLWTPAKDNPAVCKIWNKNVPLSGLSIPPANGVYHFNLLVTTGTDSASYQTRIIRDENGLHGFNIDEDHAAWIDSAVIYEINPSVFVKHGSYDAITEKLGEIKLLGINTIWLQPVYQTDNGGQGYSVTDYFKLRDDYGTEKQLRNLIAVAKKLQLRVMFDFVPNHTSVKHPYALDCIKYGSKSHYYNFYQHDNDGKAYSSYYHKDDNGFIYYFWKDLVNLDYNNPEVQQWMLEAAKYWLRKFDLDGYRFDAMWGLNARSPQFIKRLQTELKSIKPDILLLAEDRAADKLVYSSGFDAAYDWTADTAWVSQWAWQTKYNARKSLTIFNLPDTLKRRSLLHKVLFDNQHGATTTLKFIENNDVPRFIASHDLAMTKLAAGLLFSLPGLPMLYNGQEVGCSLHPYSSKPVFDRDHSIESADSLHLLSYYKNLIHLRLAHPALFSSKMNDAPVADERYLLAFNRWKDDEHFIIVFNLGSSPENAAIMLNSNITPVASGGYAYAVDVLTDKKFEINQSRSELLVPVDGYGIRWLLLK